MCRVSRGLSGTKRIVISAGQRLGSATESLSYDEPRISAIALSNCPAQASCELFIYGSGFGFDDYTPQARVGRTACMATPWTSESSMICKVPRGTGQFTSVMITAAISAGSMSWVFSYDAPYIAPSSFTLVQGTGSQISESEITAGSTEGNITVAFQGRNFGPYHGDVAVTFGHPTISFVGGFDAYVCEVDPRTNDTYLVCIVPPGIGAQQRFRVVVDRQSSVGTDVLNYPPPSLAGGTLRIVGVTSAETDVNGTSTTAGTDVIELKGANFGPYSKDVHISLGPLPGATKYACTVLAAASDISNNHTTVQCSLGAGVGTQHVFNITVGRQSTVGTATFNYPPPRFSPSTLSVLGISAASSKAVGSTTVGGVDVLQVNGSNFGPDPSALIITYGHAPGYKEYACQAVLRVEGDAHTSFQCATSAGVGHSMRIRVVAGGQEAVSGDTFSYPAPRFRTGSLRILGSRCTSPSRCYSLTVIPNPTLCGI